MFAAIKIPATRLTKALAEQGIKKKHGKVFSTLSRQVGGTSEPGIRSVRSSILGDSLARDQHGRFSTVAMDTEVDHVGPMGDLFDMKRGAVLDQTWVGKTASIRRVFGPSANANGLLTCGGEELARHASFDPDYNRARGWIQNRAIGPAVLSPVLISGLVGALVEAAFPQSVPVNASMHQARPLIVGQEACAVVQVTAIKHYARDGEEVSTKEIDFGRKGMRFNS